MMIGGPLSHFVTKMTIMAFFGFKAFLKVKQQIYQMWELSEKNISEICFFGGYAKILIIIGFPEIQFALACIHTEGNKNAIFPKAKV